MNENTLEAKMLIAKDTKKEFDYNKSSGEWFWSNRGEGNYPTGPFPTFYQALCDAVEPYETGDQ